VVLAQPRGHTLGGPSNSGNVHPARSGLFRSSQSGRAETQWRGEPRLENRVVALHGVENALGVSGVGIDRCPLAGSLKDLEVHSTGKMVASSVVSVLAASRPAAKTSS
jgi:hypothetical protein